MIQVLAAKADHLEATTGQSDIGVADKSWQTPKELVFKY